MLFNQILQCSVRLGSRLDLNFKVQQGFLSQITTIYLVYVMCPTYNILSTQMSENNYF